MRISDWSSDVCSSDLGDLGIDMRLDHQYRALLPFGVEYADHGCHLHPGTRSEEHTSELQSLMRISYAVFCLKKKKTKKIKNNKEETVRITITVHPHILYQQIKNHDNNYYKHNR